MHKVHVRALAASLFVIGAAACFGGLARAEAANPKVCAMLSASELRGWWGKEMTVSTVPGIVDCQWVPADGSTGSLTVQIVSARYYNEPKLGTGFKKLAGIADRAFVVNSLGGWSAGALKGKKAVVIGVDGGKTTRDTAVTILKTLARKI
jgi:hypothetical protein